MQKHYGVDKPIETHTRPASCDEVDCPTQAAGFVVNCDESTTLGRRQAHYIRTVAGRAHTESRLAGLTAFTFPPGEQCFAGHRVSLDRPEVYAVSDRGQLQRHSGPDPWLNDFGGHLDKLRKVMG